MCKNIIPDYIVAYSVRCLEDFTFQIEWLLIDQSQKSSLQSKIPDFFAAK